NGFEATVRTSGASFPPLLNLQEIYQADLAKIGVRLNVENMESNQFLAMILQGKLTGLIAHINGGPLDQDPALAFSNGVFRTDANISRFTSAEYTRLVSAGQVKPDATKRTAIYRQVAELIKDQAFALAIANYA